jgi:hypothetical protein
MADDIVLDNRRKCLREARALEHQVETMILVSRVMNDTVSLARLETMREYIGCTLVKVFKHQIRELERQEASEPPEGDQPASRR